MDSKIRRTLQNLNEAKYTFKDLERSINKTAEKLAKDKKKLEELKVPFSGDIMEDSKITRILVRATVEAKVQHSNSVKRDFASFDKVLNYKADFIADDLGWDIYRDKEHLQKGPKFADSLNDDLTSLASTYLTNYSHYKVMKALWTILAEWVSSYNKDMSLKEEIEKRLG